MSMWVTSSQMTRARWFWGMSWSMNWGLTRTERSGKRKRIGGRESPEEGTEAGVGSSASVGTTEGERAAVTGIVVFMRRCMVKEGGAVGPRHKRDGGVLLLIFWLFAYSCG